MSHRVKLAAVAERHVRAIQAWWLENRVSSPDLFQRELAATFERLSATPESGRVYRFYGGGAIRRALLPRTRHHVYYTIDHERVAVVVLAVWHSARGQPPRL